MSSGPVATAVTVPVQAVHSQEEAVILLGSLPGIECQVRSDQHDMEGTYNFLSKAFQQESSLLNPFGIVTATRGTFPIKSTAEGEATVANLFVASRDRFKGDMSAAIVLPDNTVLAQWSRNQRPTMVQSGDTVMPLNVFGAPYGQMQTSSWGMGHNYVDASGSGIKVVTKGCCQPKNYLLCASCLCFFPTFGIGSCIIMCKMQKTPGLFNLTRTPDGPTVGTMKYWATESSMSQSTRIRLEFPEDTDAKTKLQATLVALFFIADAYIDPPKSSGGDSGGDGGGGGGGAPDVAVMDR